MEKRYPLASVAYQWGKRPFEGEKDEVGPGIFQFFSKFSFPQLFSRKILRMPLTTFMARFRTKGKYSMV